MDKRLISALRALAVAVSALGLFGCGGGSGGPPGVTTIDAGSAIGVAGGTLGSPDSMVSIAIPPAALASDTTISITKSDDNMMQVGGIYNVSGPGGTDLVFSQPVTITLTYDPKLVPSGTSEADLHLELLSPLDGWETLPDSVVNTTNHTVTATTLHFSAVAVRQTYTAVSNPILSFPLRLSTPGGIALGDSPNGNTPYTAQITAVFDHAKTETGCPGGGVVAYTGEQGTFAAPESEEDPVPSFNKSCPSKKLFSFYRSVSDRTPFIINPHYSGNNGRNAVLTYDGHAGIDYPVDAANVYAATSGTLSLSSECWNADGTAIKSKENCYGQVMISSDVDRSYTTYSTHLSRIIRKAGRIEREEKIGISGNTAPASSPVGKHLHFQVKKQVKNAKGQTVTISVDPYGWDGALGADPYSSVIGGGDSVRLWAEAPPTSVPTVSLLASPASITAGQSATLTWSSTNATSCTASGGSVGWNGSQPVSGSTTVSPNTTTIYTLMCAGAGGTGGNSSTVSVAALSAPTVLLAASRTSITAGQSATLTWSRTNATSCTASGGSVGWNGSQPVSGSTTVSPSTTTTYTLTCAGAGGTGSNSTTVSVGAIGAPTVLIAASPTSITAGQSATLTWSSTNATSCTASGGWTGSQPVSGSISVTPTSTAIYTLACSGPGGTDNNTATVNVAGTPPSVTTVPLNDTGITPSQCYRAGSDVLVSCTSAEALALNDKQDGMVGRDVTANNASDGALGFSFRLVAKAGGGSYDKTECVFDAVTGLTWEGKPASGLRRGGNTYTNWGDGRSGDASEYVGYVNSVSLCGHTDWRLPTVTELLGIVNYGIAFPGPTIDGAWFPNTVNSGYWFSSPYASSADYVSGVIFADGSATISNRSSSYHVRLVR